jgi:hypothetical protein
MSVSPNPFSNELTILVTLAPGENYQLEVTDLNGAIVHQKECTYASGFHKLNTSEWKSGTYIIGVVSDNGIENIKVLKK